MRNGREKEIKRKEIWGKVQRRQQKEERREREEAEKRKAKEINNSQWAERGRKKEAQRKTKDK